MVMSAPPAIGLDRWIDDTVLAASNAQKIANNSIEPVILVMTAQGTRLKPLHKWRLAESSGRFSHC
jgi:hypothetical protein